MTTLPAPYNRWADCPTCRQVVHVDLEIGHAAGCAGPTADFHPASSTLEVPDEQVYDYAFTVEGAPVGYKRVGGEFTRTDGKGKRRKYRALDPKVRAHRKLVRDAAKAAIPPLVFDHGPVALTVVAVHLQPKNGRRHPDAATWSDWDNLGKLVSDSIGWRDDDEWGAFWDDGQVVAGSVLKRFGPSPRTLVRLCTFTDRNWVLPTDSAVG